MSKKRCLWSSSFFFFALDLLHFLFTHFPLLIPSNQPTTPVLSSTHPSSSSSWFWPQWGGRLSPVVSTASSLCASLSSVCRRSCSLVCFPHDLSAGPWRQTHFLFLCGVGPTVGNTYRALQLEHESAVWAFRNYFVWRHNQYKNYNFLLHLKSPKFETYNFIQDST